LVLKTAAKGIVALLALLLVAHFEPAAEAGTKNKRAKRQASRAIMKAAGMKAAGMKAAGAQATGNGARSGYRYTLNVIAFENCPDNPFTGSNRHMIAVQADFGDSPDGKKPTAITRVNDILLEEGDFQVADGNACDRDGARFLLPANPCADANPEDGVCEGDDPTFQEYEVFMRLVGPHGGVTVTTCATDPGLCVDGLCEDGSACSVDTDCDVIACSSEDLVEVRTKGKKFEDVTKDLLTLVLDTDGDGIDDSRIELFNPALEDFFWNWNTSGKPHAQLFFMPFPD
jgi:hypothetical protein